MSADQIIGVVCDAMGVTEAEVTGTGRHPRVVVARALIFDNIRRRTWMSYPEIARATGRPNHSTVKYSLNSLKARSAATLFDRFKAWDRLPDWTPTMTLADLAAACDAKVTAIVGECHGQGDATMDTAIQRKLRAMKVEEERQKAQEPPAVPPEPIPALPANIAAMINPASRCPQCGLRQLAPGGRVNGRVPWACPCGWKATGR